MDEFTRKKLEMGKRALEFCLAHPDSWTLTSWYSPGLMRHEPGLMRRDAALMQRQSVLKHHCA